MASRKRSSKKVPKALGDVITVNNRGDHNALAAGRGARAIISSHSHISGIDNWRRTVEKHVDGAKDLLPADKTDLKENVAKVADEVAKGKKADPGRLERLLNTIGAMAPDIFDVAVTTLASPLAGIGLVAKKIGDKAKVETK